MNSHPKMKFIYVGVDSHKGTHTAVVLDCFFEKLGEIVVENAPSHFDDFLSEVVRFKKPGTKIVFGLEDTTSYGRSLMLYLVGRKYKVLHVNASLVAQERKTLCSSREKSDSIDAEACARLLISRFNELPAADPQDKFWVLQQLVVRRRSIVKTNANLKNHVQSFITSHYPSYHKFFSKFDCKSSLAFYEKYPSPSRLKGVTAGELEEFFKEVTDGRQYKGKAELILGLVAKDGDTTTGYQESRNLAVQSSLSQISSNEKELEKMDGIIEEFMQHFPYKLRSMKGIDLVTEANLIAEIGDIKKFTNASKLARYAGIAPTTWESGKSGVQYSNERGNRTLNTTIYHLAVMVTLTAGKNKTIVNPIFYDYFQKRISEGKTKHQALKCVERRLVNIIWSMMTYGREYINPPTAQYAEKETDVKENKKDSEKKKEKEKDDLKKVV